MDERTLKWLWDAQYSSKQILLYVKQKNLADFCENEFLQMAVERRFEILGEALNRIRNKDEESLITITDYDKVIGLRNLLAHEYDRLDPAILFDVIQNKLPKLIREIDLLLE